MPREPKGDGVRFQLPTILHDRGIDRLIVEDRLALAQEIWDSVAQELPRKPWPPAKKQELERRLAESQAHPDAVTPWEVVRQQALARANR